MHRNGTAKTIHLINFESGDADSLFTTTHFAHDLESIGDLNGDGLEDIVAGFRADTYEGGLRGGRVMVGVMSSSGHGFSDASILPASDYTTNSASYDWGAWIATMHKARDVGGTNEAVIAVAAQRESEIHFITVSGADLSGTAITQISIDEFGSFLANSNGLECPGDINGDGNPDLIYQLFNYPNQFDYSFVVNFLDSGY